jgi:hypothetical protein
MGASIASLTIITYPTVTSTTLYYNNGAFQTRP